MTSRTTYFPLVSYVGLCIVVLCAGQVYANQESFPFVAESAGDRVNVRAGQSANFERLCQLNIGEEVVVVGKEYSWYKIQLPPSANSYISKGYVQFLGQNAGGITANNVNIRAGAGIHFTTLGQLMKGEQIYIQEEFDKWYRIEPVSDSYGWVSEKFLTFKSKDISGFQVKFTPKSFRIFKKDEAEKPSQDQSMEKEVESIEIETNEEVVNKIGVEFVENKVVEMAEEKDFEVIDEIVNEVLDGVDENKIQESFNEDVPKLANNDLKVKKSGMITVLGYVEPYENEGVDGIFYKIISEEKPVAYIHGTNHMLGRFLHYRVSVSGTINKKFQSQYEYPVISVLKVRLML